MLKFDCLLTKIQTVKAVISTRGLINFQLFQRRLKSDILVLVYQPALTNMKHFSYFKHSLQFEQIQSLNTSISGVLTGKGSPG